MKLGKNKVKHICESDLQLGTFTNSNISQLVQPVYKFCWCYYVNINDNRILLLKHHINQLFGLPNLEDV